MGGFKVIVEQAFEPFPQRFVAVTYRWYTWVRRIVTQCEHILPLVRFIDQTQFIGCIDRRKKVCQAAVTIRPAKLDLAVRAAIEQRPSRTTTVVKLISYLFQAESVGSQQRSHNPLCVELTHDPSIPTKIHELLAMSYPKSRHIIIQNLKSRPYKGPLSVVSPDQQCDSAFELGPHRGRMAHQAFLPM